MIKVDVKKCVGCRICEMVCSYHHKGSYNPIFSSIKVNFKKNYDIEIILLDNCDCRQDEDFSCVNMCPVYNCISFK